MMEHKSQDDTLGAVITFEGSSEPFLINSCSPSSTQGKATLNLSTSSGQHVGRMIDSETLRRINSSSSKVAQETYFSRNTVCPLCSYSSARAKPLFSVVQLLWEVKVLECPICHLAYKEFFPRDNLLRLIYQPNYVHYSITDDFEGELSKYRFRLKRMGKPVGRHLDYGCGAGSFVGSALLAGWDSYGADPYLPDDAFKHSLSQRLYKLDVLEPSTLEILGKFDYISLWAVMEHLKPLGNVLQGLIKLLKPGVKLIFNSPNPNSHIARKAGATWRMATLIEHLQFLSPKCVDWIANSFGLRIQNFRISGSPYPFGKGDRGLSGQGITVLPFQAIQIDEEFSLTTVNKKSFKSHFRKLFSRIYQRGFTVISSSSSSEITRRIIHWTRSGDHIETILIKY